MTCTAPVCHGRIYDGSRVHSSLMNPFLLYKSHITCIKYAKINGKSTKSIIPKVFCWLRSCCLHRFAAYTCGHVNSHLAIKRSFDKMYFCITSYRSFENKKRIPTMWVFVVAVVNLASTLNCPINDLGYITVTSLACGKGLIATVFDEFEPCSEVS